jgi:hypothetical protein
VEFGPVVKTLGITVKKEACEVVETQGWRNVVKPQATKEFKNGPGALEGAQKRGTKDFLISVILRF